MKKFISLFLALLIYSILPNSNAFANFKGDKTNKKIKANTFLQKTATNPNQTVLNINNITSWIDENGFMAPVIGSSWNGTFPKGTVGAIYQEGIVWGGKVQDGQSPEVRVTGNTYVGGTTRLTRIVRVRPDYKTADLTDDAANFFLVPNIAVTAAQIDQIKAQYETDWNEWPATLGAPFDDKDGNGVYDPAVDVPGVPGASQTIFLSYDDRNSSDNYGSPPIGIKVNETLWAYSIANPLGNVIFKRVQMIYEGTSTSSPTSSVDSMYIVQWSDPDVGQYTDDFAGSDPSLNLGYAYSSKVTDAVYSSIGSPPPAVGYDFLQGVSEYTGDPNDSAIVNLKWVTGRKYVNSQPLSTFVYFAAGGAWGDPSFDYNGTLQWYNLMQGYESTTEYPIQKKFPTNVPGVFVGGDGTYLLDGDPVAGTGWIDGVVEGAGDRRIVNVTGPFTLNIKDTTEIVVALVGGLGTNNLSSISYLKFNDKFAQFAYDNLFVLPSMPVTNTNITALDGEVLLNWGTDLATLNSIENSPHAGYKFQGYNVYQLPSATTDLSKAKKIATFDLIDNVTTILDDQLDPTTGAVVSSPVQVGKDSGIKRFLTIRKDAFRGNDPIVNGQTYYFAVTAYGYNPKQGLPFSALESSPVPLSATPHSPDPGVRYGSKAGKVITMTHASGASDGKITATVVNPTKLTGSSYKIQFWSSTDSSNSDALSDRWGLLDATKGKIIYTGIGVKGGDLLIDGLQVKVDGPPEAIKDWSYTGNRWISGTNWGGSALFGGMDIGKNFFGSDLPAAAYVPIDWVFTDNPTPSESNGWSKGPVVRRDQGYVFSGIGWMPFKAFDVTDPANPRQVNVSFVEDANNGSANLKWDMGWDGSAFAANGGREYTFIHTTSYDPTMYNGDAFTGSNDPTYNDVAYAIWPNKRGSRGYLLAPFTISIVPNYVIVGNDVFTFTTANLGTSSNSSLAKTDVQKINVFPNPYYGYNYRETSRSNKYVTFSHLPAKATIRIFTLAGVQVKRIEKNNSSSQFTSWDLRNEGNYPVASGIYVVYIDMPSLGTTKILKLAVIQEQQILNVY